MLNREQYILIKIAEEAAEVIQDINKTLIFGLNEKYHKSEFTNRERIVNEITDMFALINLAHEEKILPLPEFPVTEAAVISKQEKFEKYFKYSQELGVVE